MIILKMYLNFTLMDHLKIDNARLGKIYGDILAREIPQFLYELALLIENKNINFNDYVETYEEELIELVDKYKK